MTAAQPVAIAAELLTEAECVRRIPGRDATVREWLRSLEGVRRRSPSGVICYVWPDVLTRLPLADEPLQPAPTGPRGSLRRSSKV